MCPEVFRASRRPPSVLGWIWRGLALLFAWLPGTVLADQSLQDPGLERWLEDAAVPRLSERLNTHPRLRGQPLRIVAAPPDRQPNALESRLAVRLAQWLRTRPGVRLLDSAPRCEAQPPLQLRVVVAARQARRHRVELTFLDPVAGEWIGGLGAATDLDLTRPAAALAARSVPAVPDGSVERPLPAVAVQEIALQLAAQFDCRLLRPHGWSGGIDVSTLAVTDARDAAIVGALQRRLVALSGVRADTTADWRLLLERSGLAWRLLVRPATSGDGGAVEVARVWTVGAMAVAAGQGPLETHPAGTPAPARSALIRRLELAPAARDGICRVVPSDQRCHEITLETAPDTWSMLLWVAGPVDDRQLHSTACRPSLSARRAQRTFRVLDAGGPLAVFALAASDPHDVLAVQRLVRNAPGGCAGSRLGAEVPPPMLASWLGGLDAEIAAVAPAVEWRRVAVPATQGALLAAGQQ